MNDERTTPTIPGSSESFGLFKRDAPSSWKPGESCSAGTWLLERQGPAGWTCSAEAPGDPKAFLAKEPEQRTRAEQSWVRVQKAVAIFNWMEGNLKIRTKKKRLKPFHFNDLQLRLSQHVAWCWAMLLPVYVLVPKARQGGVSTWWQGLFRALAQFESGFLAVTVAHVDQSATRIFGYTKTFEKHLPKSERMGLETQQAAELTWVNDASISVGSAKAGDNLEKGRTLHAIHFSEVANYADAGADPNVSFSSALGALETSGEEILSMESTAKGRDPFFYDIVDKSLRGENRFIVLFFPWYLTPEYRVKWEDFRHECLLNPRAKDPGEKFVPTEDETILRAKVSSLHQDESNNLYVHPYAIDDEQLIWRRRTIANDCNGHEEHFRRYYPATIEEAFESSQSCMFASQTISYYFRHSRPPETRGGLRDVGKVTPEWQRAERGSIQVWEMPVPGEQYVIGADVAEGKGAKNADFSCAYVVHADTHKVVALFHDQLDEDLFADILARLGCFYNWALIAVENNNNSVPTRLAKDPILYPNLHWQRSAELAPGKPRIPGWNTNKKTRPLLLEVIARLTRERHLVNPDKGFAREMEAFVWSTKKNRFQASNGKHDDRIMSLGIALYLCPDVGERVEHETTSEECPVVKWARTLREREDEQARHEVDGVLML